MRMRLGCWECRVGWLRERWCRRVYVHLNKQSISIRIHEFKLDSNVPDTSTSQPNPPHPHHPNPSQNYDTSQASSIPVAAVVVGDAAAVVVVAAAVAVVAEQHERAHKRRTAPVASPLPRGTPPKPSRCSVWREEVGRMCAGRGTSYSLWVGGRLLER